MNTGKSHHVICHPKGGWAVKRYGSSKASKVYETQPEAITAARKVSANQKTDLYIHRPDGRVSAKYENGIETMKPKLKSKKIDLVQIKNPRANRYVKIDRSEGLILGHKKSTGPYKGVKIARKRHKRDLTDEEAKINNDEGGDADCRQATID